MALRRIDLCKPLKPIEWATADLIVRGYFTLVGAREGVGKTAILSGLGWQMTRPPGRGRFLGRTVAHGAVIYLNTDAPDGEGRPVRYWQEKHQAAHPDGDRDKFLVFEPEGGGLEVSEVVELERLILEHEVVAVILDSFMGSFPATDANKLHKAMGPLVALRDLAARTNVALIVVDHLGKPGAGERNGDRGVMGSVSKQAQSRAVHILTRVEPKDTGGVEMIRWEVTKQSFARRLEPFDVTLKLEGEDSERARLETCDLPEEYRETGLGRAERAVVNHLETNPGVVIHRADLIAVAIRDGNVKERQAEDALKKALGKLGKRVQIIKLPLKGSPKAYRLLTEDECKGAENQNPLVQDKSDFPQPTGAGNGGECGETLDDAPPEWLDRAAAEWGEGEDSAPALGEL